MNLLRVLGVLSGKKTCVNLGNLWLNFSLNYELPTMNSQRDHLRRGVKKIRIFSNIFERFYTIFEYFYIVFERFQTFSKVFKKNLRVWCENLHF